MFTTVLFHDGVLIKQVIYHTIGNPTAVLETQTVETPTLNSSEVRVSILATPIHPSDLLKISGQYGVLANPPEVPGSEGVGEVIEIASDVQQLHVGQRVFIAGYSTWQQQVVGPENTFIPLPQIGDLKQLSMLMINPITALRLLDGFVDLTEGDWLIQNAANSAVGTYLIQLARLRGVRTLNVVRNQNAVSRLEELGATHVLVDGPDLKERVRKLTNGEPIRLGIDAVGGKAFSKMVETLSFRGTVVCYGLMSMEQPLLPSSVVIFNELTVRGFWLAKWFETVEPKQKQQTFAQVISLVSQGKLHADIAATFSLDDIHEAVSMASQSGRIGKVLLLPSSD